jgi:hypothetical protein
MESDLEESLGAWPFVLFSKFYGKEVCRDPLGGGALNLFR